jgi:hypothetical protein
LPARVWISAAGSDEARRSGRSKRVARERRGFIAGGKPENVKRET